MDQTLYKAHTKVPSSQQYETISCEIRLNPENDDVELFELKIGGQLIEFSEEDLAKLKDPG